MTFQDFIEEYQKVPVEEYPNSVLEKVPVPVVSCRVSTYQHAPFIRQCLEGILMQKTNFPIEIVIGEDESLDGTREICIEYAKKHPDIIRLFLHKRENNILVNGEPSSKFQGTYTMFKLRSKYQAICEGDDYWTDPYKLQKQVDFLEGNPEYGLVYSDVDRYYQSNKILEKHIFKNILSLKENTFEDFLVNAWWLAPCTWMIRRDTLDQLPRYPSNFRVGDFPMLLSLARFSKIGFISDSTAVYRVLEKSASRNNSNWRFDYSLRKGIFEIQLYFGERHDVSAFLMDKIYSNYYREKINDSILLHDKPMYNVASNYLRSRGMLNWKNRLLLFAAEWPLVLRIAAKIWRKE
jgi:glycosyltransferase involved in cell wall biosynthesis